MALGCWTPLPSGFSKRLKRTVQTMLAPLKVRGVIVSTVDRKGGKQRNESARAVSRQDQVDGFRRLQAENGTVRLDEGEVEIKALVDGPRVGI